MKHLLLTTIAAVVLMGCGESQQSSSPAEAKTAEPVAEATKPITPPKAVTANKGADPARGIKPAPLTVEAPAISIHDAVESGNIEVVKQYIAAGKDVNVMPGIDITPLDYAYIYSPEIVGLLLKHGGKKGVEISICVAAKKGDIAAVKQHIANGKDVNEKDDVGRTPLHRAASSGNTEIAQLLIAKDAHINAKDDNGLTPLDKAIGRPNFIDLIRKHGGKHGTIHSAAGNGDIEQVREFLVAGTDVNVMTGSDTTPLDDAISSNHLEIADLLLKHGGKKGVEISICVAAKKGDIAALKQHITNGKDVNEKDSDVKTPLDWAENVYGDSPELKAAKKEIAKILRKHGGKHGTIHSAARNGDIEEVKEFLAAGTDVNAKDKDGWTALLMAASRGKKEIVKLLLAKGAKVNAKSNNGTTPLHMSSKAEVAELLIANGADVNARTQKGSTPLHFSAQHAASHIVKLLIPNGADVNLKNGFGKTPLESTRNPKIADLLRKHGGKTKKELEAAGN